MMELRVCHLYPDLMNTYGDAGDMLTIRRRCEWRGIRVRIVEVSLGGPGDLSRCDILFIGGGQDRQQRLVAHDLMSYKAQDLSGAVESDAVVLAVCGGYQLLGRYYRLPTGEQLPGIGVLDAWTESGAVRLTGNIVVDAEFRGKRMTLVGFENHSGRTYLGPRVRILGRVLRGSGNNGRDMGEGVVFRNVVGTYLHGPLLPRNPALCDELIKAAVARKYGKASGLCALPPLDDRLEEQARDEALAHARVRL
ncbi:MAG: glutamine amidotransferase [Clostridia bacterium]|nr:glutamine amidotransferase [Clostridia bacterium]